MVLTQPTLLPALRLAPGPLASDRLLLYAGETLLTTVLPATGGFAVVAMEKEVKTGAPTAGWIDPNVARKAARLSEETLKDRCFMVVGR